MTIACLGWGSLIWDPRDLLLGSAWREDGPQLLLQVVEELRDVRKGREMLSFGGCRHLWPPFGTVAAGSKMAGQEIRTVGGV